MNYKIIKGSNQELSDVIDSVILKENELIIERDDDDQVSFDTSNIISNKDMDIFVRGFAETESSKENITLSDVKNLQKYICLSFKLPEDDYQLFIDPKNDRIIIPSEFPVKIDLDKIIKIGDVEIKLY